LGLQFKITKVVSFNVAMNCEVASYSPTRWSLKTYSVNGVNRLGSLPAASLAGQYVTETSSTSSNAGQRIKYSAAMSNIGLVAGFCFKIGYEQKKKTKKEGAETIHSF